MCSNAATQVTGSKDFFFFYVNYSSVMCALLDEKFPTKLPTYNKYCYGEIVKTWCAVVINQTVIDSDVVLKQIITDLRGRRALDKNQLLPRHLIDI